MIAKSAVCAVWIVVRFIPVPGFSMGNSLSATLRPNAAVDEWTVALRIRPIAPERMSRAACTAAGFSLACKSTAVRSPLRSPVLASSSVCAVLVPAGHSVMTCLPALSAATMRSRCAGTGAVTATISISGSAIRSAGLP